MVGSARLSPGFRFHPTDVELVRFYLKRKVMGKKLPFHCITELEIYKHAPWDLPLKSVLRTGDLKWYFFCPREKKYAIGPRMKRAAEGGYWKSTGKDRPVLYDNEVAGMIRTLVFHLGKPPKGERTDWVMYEYRLEDKKLIDSGVSQDSYVLSVLFKKDGPGPKNGAQYGAPFKEEEWESDDEEDEVNDGIGAALWAGASTPSTVLSIERTNSAVTSPVVPDGSCVVSQVSCPAEKENAYVVGPVGLDNTNASEGVAQALHGGLEDVFSAAPLAFQLNPQGEYCASGGTFQAQHSPQTVHVASEEHGEAVHTGFEPVAENDDVLAMLDYFTEEAPFTLDQLNNTEMMNIPNQVGSVAAGPCLDGIDIYNNLEDVGSLASFDESQGLINGVDYTFTGGHLEMMDLDTPLNEGFFLRQDVDQFRGLQGGGSGMQNNNVHDSNRGCEDMVEELLNPCWRQNG